MIEIKNAKEIEAKKLLEMQVKKITGVNFKKQTITWLLSIEDRIIVVV